MVFLTNKFTNNFSGFFIFGLSIFSFSMIRLYLEFNKPIEIGFYNEIELPINFSNWHKNKTILLEEEENSEKE